MADGKKHFCRLACEFGNQLPDGTLDLKQPSEVKWLSLDYDEAMTLQIMVFRPMIRELTDDGYELGVRKAVAEGKMDEKTAETLLSALGKMETKARR